MMTLLGTRFGPYEITANLGEVGMGQIWKARELHFGRDVALKVVLEGFVRDWSSALARAADCAMIGTR